MECYDLSLKNPPKKRLKKQPMYLKKAEQNSWTSFRLVTIGRHRFARRTEPEHKYTQNDTSKLLNQRGSENALLRTMVRIIRTAWSSENWILLSSLLCAATKILNFPLWARKNGALTTRDWQNNRKRTRNPSKTLGTSKKYVSPRQKT